MTIYTIHYKICICVCKHYLFLFSIFVNVGIRRKKCKKLKPSAEPQNVIKKCLITFCGFLIKMHVTAKTNLLA